VRGVLGPGQRGARLFRPNAPHRDSCNHELVSSPQGGRDGRRIKIGEHTLSLIQSPD
jgi:hypothetical protein